MNIFRAFTTVGGWTLASRVLGFVRDKLFAHFVGAGEVSDAFFTAFRIPNLFRRFLAEGAFNSAFVPQYSVRKDEDGGGQEFAQSAFTGLLWVSLALIAVVMIATPLFVLLLAYNFQGTERLDLAVNYSRITIFYIGFMSLSALCAGILNANGRYQLSSAAPLILNIVFILAFVLIYLLGLGPQEGFSDAENVDRLRKIGMIASLSVLLSGVLQFAAVYYGVRKLGIRLRPTLPTWNDDIKNLFVVAVPAALANSTVQINLIVGTQIAATTDKAISWLYYADRIYQLPLGMIGVAVGVVLLPTLSGLLKDGNSQGARTAYNQGMNFAMLLTLPAAAAIFVIALPILRTVFEGGQFTQADAIETSKSLSIYALGLPAFVLVKLVQPIFYAVGNTKTPARHALVNVVLHAVLALGLYPFFGYLSAAWAITISTWAMVCGLWISAHKRGDTAHLDMATLKNISIYALMSLLMAVLIWFVCNVNLSIFDDAISKWFFLGAVVLFGAFFYFIGVMALARIGLRDIKRMMRG